MGSTDTRTHYDLLGVDRTATTEQIRLAYKEIARVYHPDSNFYNEIVPGMSTGSGDIKKFQILTQAYHTLANAEKRKAYDATLAPILPGWETEREEEFHERFPQQNTQAANSNLSGAFGVFGRVSDTPPQSEIEKSLEREMEYQSTIIRRGVKRGFFSRLLRAIGL